MLAFDDVFKLVEAKFHQKCLKENMAKCNMLTVFDIYIQFSYFSVEGFKSQGNNLI